MKNIKLIILTIAVLVTLAMPLKFVMADPCPPGNLSPSPTEAVCNPSSSFFVDLGGHDQNTFKGLLLYVIEGLIGLVGLLSLVFIILGGFQYITSNGNEEQAEAGKKTLTNAIIGLVIVILSYEIVVVVTRAVFGQVK